MSYGVLIIIIQLGGVVIPHDGQCYLEQRGNIFQYTMAETLVSQAAFFVIISYVHAYRIIHQLDT